LTKKIGSNTLISCSDTNEIIPFRQYKQSNHWKLLVNQYNKSNLVKKCFICKEGENITSHIHRTFYRIGKEKLTDIVPICFNCKDKKLKHSKKKTERYLLSKYQFNYKKLSNAQKDKLMNIKPDRRGKELTKHYQEISSDYKPSSTWINIQVKQTCKWIHKQEKYIFNLPIDE
tara:strand:+ start:6611 stop:7129 length:519 start_codon:yes stop_codon:yes gene_type:complete